MPPIAREVNDDIPAGNGDSGAGQDTSLNVPQENEVATAPEEERSSEEESLSSEEESQPLRRSTRNRRPPRQYRDGTYLMYPQIATTAQWKAEFDVLWSRFPWETPGYIPAFIKPDKWPLMDELSGTTIFVGRDVCYTLDVRVNSVAHRVPWWRIRLWPNKCVFYDMILHQAGMHVRGMFGYVWHDCRN